MSFHKVCVTFVEFGHRTGHAHLFPDWRAPLSPAERNKQKTNVNSSSNTALCLRVFLDCSPVSVFWRYFYIWIWFVQIMSIFLVSGGSNGKYSSFFMRG